MSDNLLLMLTIGLTAMNLILVIIYQRCFDNSCENQESELIAKTEQARMLIRFLIG
ncbi:MAG: hypothetical protein JSR76_06105 [Verrucomicrobia bacterium]|nr:hypothetical protein [Verrucomicrobiota bacterium]